MAKRIVIADDSATIQRAFAMTFGAEDVTLVAARSADEGLSLAKQVQTDLVIADGMMPGRSGYDLCAAIKADAALAGTAVYILASSQQPYDDMRGQQCGADGHFSKPFDTTLIIDKVHEALARAAHVNGAVSPPPVRAEARLEVRPPPPPSPPPSPPPFPPPSPAAPPVVALEPGRDLGTGRLSSALAMDEDDYGELSVDMSPEDAGPREVAVEYLAPPSSAASSVASSPAPSAASSVSLPSSSGSSASPLAPPPAFVPPPAFNTPTPVPISPASLFQSPAPAVPAPAAGMRPSLIPGIRPGAVAPARPGTMPVRPMGPGAAPPSRPPVPPSRTLMGLPAANLPIPGTVRPVAAPSLSQPVSQPASQPASQPPWTPPPSASLSTTVSSMVSAAVGSAVDEKMAALAARGPEYEAIAHLSREIIQQIVWEIVPELAEAIIREHLRTQLDKQDRN